MVSPASAPPSSSHNPSHWDPLLFCLSLKSKQFFRDNNTAKYNKIKHDKIKQK